MKLSNMNLDEYVYRYPMKSQERNSKLDVALSFPTYGKQYDRYSQ